MGRKFQPKIIEKLDRDGEKSGTFYATYANKHEKTAGRMLSGELAEKNETIPEAVPVHHFPPHTPLRVVRYRKSDEVKWPCRGGDGQQAGTKIDRESIAQSRKSRQNCAFKFLNSERDFSTMVLLSWPGEMQKSLRYDDVKESRTKFLKRLRRRCPGIGFGWFLEFGEVSENPHIHLFTTSELEAEVWQPKLRENSEQPVEVAGPCDTLDWIVEAWQDAAGIDSEKAENFNRGYFDKSKGFWVGTMLEKLRCPEAAGKYAAKEASKRIQKTAPWPVKQWWYISRDCTPKPRSETDFSAIEYMQNFPDNPIMMSKLFDRLEVVKKAA